MLQLQATMACLDVPSETFFFLRPYLEGLEIAASSAFGSKLQAGIREGMWRPWGPTMLKLNRAWSLAPSTPQPGLGNGFEGASALWTGNNCLC